MNIEYLVFLITFLYLSNRFQVNTFAKQLFREKGKVKELKDKQIFDNVFKKTGLKLRSIKLFESETPFGMMPGIPWRSDMILSTNLYKTFSKDELEYVVMHEVGHCKMWHTVKFAFIEILFAMLGLNFLYFLPKNDLLILASILAGVVYAIIFVQVARFFERQAEEFAVSKMDNPEGMISAVEKFKKGYPDTTFFYIKRFLFGWNIFPEEKIEVAEKEIEKRKLRDG